MCGIAGVVGDVSAVEARAVRSMCSAMVHRGPDDEGFFDGPAASLGMRRLSIIDVEHGVQPVYSETGNVAAVFNGEIYNFQSLQEQLRDSGHRLASNSDSECLPHLYEDHGDALPQYLNGMFALAVWDRAQQRLLLARDRVGKKPLYYYADGNRLWFASELKCLLAVSTIPRNIDPMALDRYLTFQYVPHPYSILEGVRKLPPAHMLTWQAGQLKVRPYWKLSFPPRGISAGRTEDELCEELRSYLLEATEARVVSERPLGAFLSGGLDSSAVVAAMARISDRPVSTFSIGFDEEEFNELPYARAVADQYSTNHHEHIVKPDIEEILPRIVRMFDEPFADSSAIPSYYVAEMARQHAVVVLTGDGGDESFGGYSRYSLFLSAAPRLRLPAGPTRTVTRLANRINRRTYRNQRIRNASRALARAAAPTPGERYARMMSYFTPEELKRLYSSHLASELAGNPSPYADFAHVWRSLQGTDSANQLMGVDIATYLPGDLLTKVDITSMAVSLEARSPLLDHRLMEWAARLPGNLKARSGETKYLLKKAMEPWLPRELIHRQKMGFAIPREDWLRGPLRPMVHDLLLSSGSRISAYLNPAEIHYWVKRNERFVDSGPQVWALLMLELWHREVLEGEPKCQD